MTANDVLSRIEAAGGEVVLVNGEPRLRAAAPLPAVLVELAREHRAGIIRILRDGTEADWPESIPRWPTKEGCHCALCSPQDHGFRNRLEAARAAF
ncbi:MAG: hypothetical protein HY900_32200, partial [Deltaproteobacteria bacterium]|nr:hypothetical protein [Deltaproteobacteria bacterium]